MGNIKIGNRDITGIFIGNQYISKVQLGSNNVIWEYLKGELDNGNVTYEYIDGTLTFSGTGTIPVIADSGDTKDLYQKASSTKKIIVNDSITEIEEGAFGAFENLQEITLPFVGKNAKSEYFVHPFGYIFGQSGSSSSSYYSVESYIKNDFESYQYYLPKSLVEVILTGGQYNKTYLYENSFRNCTYIQKLVIPNNIINIENGALFHCKNLTTLTIPFIGRSIFSFDKSPGPGRYQSLTFGNYFGRSSSKPSSSNDYKVISSSWYAGYNVDDGSYTTYESSSPWGLMPTSLKNLIVTGGDIPWWAFGFIGGQLQTIKFISTNPNYPTKQICLNAFDNLGIQESCKIYLPSSITTIGGNQNSGTNNNSKIYFQGNLNQWETLKNKYIKNSDNTGAFFNNWKVKYNSNPEDIQEVITTS